MNRRTLVIALVVIVAVGIGLITYGVFLQPHKAEIAMRPVVISAMNIPARAHITAPMVSTTTRPADQVQADALGNPSDAVGQIASIDIAEGGIITAAELTKPTPPPVGLQVPPGMRAVSIPIDQVKGVSGLLHPGDKVDVMSVPPRGDGDPRAYTFLRGVLILAIGGDYVNPNAVAPAAPGAPPAPTPPPNPAATVTLAVTPAQADQLTMADLNTTLRLALRPLNERANSQPVEPVLFPQPPKPAPSASPQSAHPGVTVINGDVAQP